MATKDNDLFDRLRQAGLRKQVAKTLSEIGEGASKRARRALSDLHSVVDELEKRLPGAITPSAAKPATTRSSAARKPAATKTGRHEDGRRDVDRCQAGRRAPPLELGGQARRLTQPQHN